VSGNNNEKQPLTRADRKHNHLAIQHRILNVLIILAAIVAIYLVVKTINRFIERATFKVAFFIEPFTYCR